MAAPGPGGYPTGYPMDLECEVVARDGTRMRGRPIRPEDSVELSRFHGSLSPRSVYRRYFYVHPDLSQKEIDHLTTVDYVDRLALVVEHGGRLVAVGRYERYPGTADAEVAFVVADAYQHLGLGTLLLRQLAGAALRTGISCFRATVLVENRAMVDVFTNSGFPMATTNEAGVISVRMSIGSAERSTVAPSVGAESPAPP